METKDAFLKKLTMDYPIDLEDASAIFEAAGKDRNYANRAAALTLYGINADNVIYFLKGQSEIFRDAAVPEELFRAYQCSWTSRDFREIQEQYATISSIIDSRGIEAALLDPDKAIVTPEMTDDPALKTAIKAAQHTFRKIQAILNPYREEKK
ncbi:hypothetical protein RJD11_12170 [Bacillus velezensis]|uniref:hypothetical protein n=1 Tax=Bacillus TaxID=1386 RepID=UPI001C52EDA3|nr:MULTISPECIES: hypothetical protein [Bacillus amyloliquefaciens group]QXP99310.1 hypothetical protein KVY05_21335 [Bacillus velezensis]UHH01348.1 hypothetical protein LUA14_12095 [Bacillus amyloliquefaciens]ULR21096.1 hypothetical protein MJE83_12095 [Bacillus velezensis]UVW07839.1 hypothetical protein NX856_12135 [Bacillus velezensis]WHL75145.1 hypothetical protein QLH34_12115 [Bacillus velezensis]